MLSPGTAQIYYGDESARNLIVEGTQGDATLRSFMNWEDIESNSETQELLSHWQKLGQFRRDHLSVGAGSHKMLSEAPYVFSRTYSNGNISDEVVIGLDLKTGPKELTVSDVFEDGTELRDAYSDTQTIVVRGQVELNTPFNVVLLEKIE